MEDNRPTKSVYSLVPLNAPLVDKRFSTMGQNFGIVEQLVQQYGVEVEIVQPPVRLVKRAKKFKKRLRTCYKFTAPRSRLQKLLEKFHFSLTKYSRQPYFR